MISDDLMRWLGDMPDRQQLRCELETLRAIKEWVLTEHIGFGPGDVVEFVTSPNTDNGWAPCREALCVGAVADVRDVSFNRHGGYWYAAIVLHREWATDSTARPVRRYWHGPAGDTPPDMEPPTPFDQENYPQGRKHTFAMPVRYLAKAEQAT